MWHFTAPALWQKTMVKVLKGIPGVFTLLMIFWLQGIQEQSTKPICARF